MKKYKKKSRLKEVLIYTAIVTVVMSVVFFLATEIGYKIRYSFAFKLIFNLIICSALLYFLKEFEIAGRVIAVCGAVATLLFTFIVTDRINYIVWLVLAVVSGVTAMTLFLCNKEYFGSAGLTGFFVFKALSIFRYTNFDNDNFYKCLIITLIICLVLFLIIVALAKFLKGANKEIFKFKMFFTVLGCVLIFSFAVVIMANYAFDFSSPTIDNYVVVETKARSRLSPTFEVRLDISSEEKWLTVSENIYYKYDIGDTATVKTYKGALGIGYKKVE